MGCHYPTKEVEYHAVLARTTKQVIVDLEPSTGEDHFLVGLEEENVAKPKWRRRRLLRGLLKGR